MKYRPVAAAIVAMSSTSTVLANSIQDTHLFRIGAFEQGIDVNASVTREPFEEVEINFDRVLGMEESATTYFAGYRWRFAEKWNLGVFYSNMSASGDGLASKPFSWDGEEYNAGIRIGTKFELDTYLVSANYSFVRNDKFEWGVGLGLHAFDIETTLDVGVRVDGFFEERRRNNSTVLAPLPNLRTYGTWAITPKWEISGDLGWLSITYDDYDGDYLFLQLMTEYRITERFGIGLSYQVSEIDVSVEKNLGEDKFNIDLYGPSLYLTYGF